MRFVFGPYLIAVPGVKVGPNKGQNGVAATSNPPVQSVVPTVGWLFDETLGQIYPNDSTNF